MDKPTLLSSSAIADRLAVLRRDLRTVLRDLAGPLPSPFLARAPLPRHQHRAPPARVTREAPALATRPVVIAAVHRETRDAVTLILECPEGRPFSFHPGQFLTLVLTLPGGEVLRRAYSLCAAPGDLPAHRAAVTVKRVAGGRASSYLNDHARAGDRLAVLGPSGCFGLTPDPAQARDVLLLGGGSGVTPLYSIARAVLAHEPASRVTLIYGNRGADDIIFHDGLLALAREHGARFTLRLVLEAPPPGWSGGQGRLDPDVCARELAALPAADPRPLRCFLCGPAPMMAAARAALLARGVDPACIAEERFSSPGAERATAPAAAGIAVALTVRARGRSHQALVQPGQTLLEAGLAAGAPMPYSCTLGGCGACKVRLVEGAVVSEEPNCLSAAERAAGYALACVSRVAAPGQPAAVEVP